VKAKKYPAAISVSRIAPPLALQEAFGDHRTEAAAAEDIPGAIPGRRFWLDTRDDLYQSVTHVWPTLGVFSRPDQAPAVLYNGFDIMN
jgi:hypothetical protein